MDKYSQTFFVPIYSHFPYSTLNIMGWSLARDSQTHIGSWQNCWDPAWMTAASTSSRVAAPAPSSDWQSMCSDVWISQFIWPLDSQFWSQQGMTVPLQWFFSKLMWWSLTREPYSGRILTILLGSTHATWMSVGSTFQQLDWQSLCSGVWKSQVVWPLDSQSWSQ